MYNLLITRPSRRSREEKTYNPSDISQHRGKVYTTRNGTEYIFKHRDCSVHGIRQPLDGIIPELVAGIQKKHYGQFLKVLAEGSREKLLDLISRVGEKVQPNYHLVFVFNRQDADRTGRQGFTSGSPLEGI